MKKTCNITWQEKDDFLADFFDSEVKNNQPIRIAHAINLFSKQKENTFGSIRSDGQENPGPPNLQLPNEQLTVIQSMRAAAGFSCTNGSPRPDLWGIANSEELHLVPPDFEALRLSHAENPSNERDLPPYANQGLLPRLFDLLNSIKQNTNDATHVVFTNADIHLQPWFYEVCCSFLQSGYDSLIVNRRTFENYPDKPIPGIPEALRHAEIGITHPGLDCFVFPISWLDQFVATSAIIGRGAVMRSLLFNMAAIAKNLLVLSHAQMTYHFGDDRPWMLPEAQAAREYNITQAAKLWLRLVQTERYKKNLVALGKIFPKYLPGLPVETLDKFLTTEK
ncbi:MAG: hypothetical protein JJT75_04045 [Opitutales bacterium]|nr:hypothetical protein [Opitutales bacterium]MCH8539398.1 hypothetical protein [Opitutales bacterium]